MSHVLGSLKMYLETVSLNFPGCPPASLVPVETVVPIMRVSSVSKPSLPFAPSGRGGNGHLSHLRGGRKDTETGARGHKGDSAATDPGGHQAE